MLVLAVSLSCPWKKKNCFACCKSKLNKENSSLMSYDLGFQVVIPFYLQLLDSR